MREKTRIVLLSGMLLSLLCNAMSAQYLYEIGFGAGISGYSGELQTRPFDSPGYSVGAFWRSNIDARYSVRIEGLIGEVAGSSEGTIEKYPIGNSDDYVISDIDFTTKYRVFDLLAEINFFPYPFDKSIMNSSNITPFMFLGFGMLNYSHVGGGQGSGVSIPFGVGVRWSFSDRWGVQAQYKANKLFVDAFDTVDNPYKLDMSGGHHNDWLHTVTFMLTYSFGQNEWNCNCPTFKMPEQY